LADVFLSYARSERDRAEPIRARLEELGLTVFFDVDGLDGGDVFPDVLDREVKAAGAVLSLWSPHALSRPWVRRESHIGMDRGVLVPVAISPISAMDVPAMFYGVQQIDLAAFKGDPADPNWGTLVRALARTLQRPDLLGREARQHAATNEDAARLRVEMEEMRQELERLHRNRHDSLTSKAVDPVIDPIGYSTVKKPVMQTTSRNWLLAVMSVAFGLAATVAAVIWLRAGTDDQNFQPAIATSESLPPVSGPSPISGTSGVADGPTPSVTPLPAPAAAANTPEREPEAAAGTAQQLTAELARTTVPDTEWERSALWRRLAATYRSDAFQLAAEQGDAKAAFLLGRAYELAVGAPRDFARAFELYGRACSAGLWGACVGQGFLYTNGQGVTRDRREGTALFSKACNQKAMEGCFAMGKAFEVGSGVNQSMTGAKNFYEQACTGGYPSGCNNLAILYQHGSIGDRDYNRANELYSKACDQGDQAACTNLGWMYEQALGVPKDVDRARNIYKTACDGENGQGCQNLAVLYQEGVSVAQDDARARAFYDRACTLGVFEGCNDLGWMLEHGVGGSVDTVRARSLYDKACRGGVSLGCSNLRKIDPP
jgi:TPR repeat protein